MCKAMVQSKGVTEDISCLLVIEVFLFILSLSIITEEWLMNFRLGLIRFRILENHQLHFEEGVGNAIKHFINIFPTKKIMFESLLLKACSLLYINVLFKI